MINKIFESLFFVSSKLSINKIALYRKKFDELNTNFIILTYHRTSKEAFMDHIQYLDKKYSIISFDEFIFRFEKRKYPSDLTFVITFDDGYNEIYTDIFPVCKELSIPIIIYISTENINNDNLFWWEEAKIINNLGGNLNIKYLKSLTTANRKTILDKYAKKLKYTLKNNKNLTEKQILELNNEKYISFGSHTVTHTNLASETEENIKYELITSKKHLEKLFNKEIVDFAYPNGAYNETVIKILKEIGYKTAVTEADSWVSKNSNFFTLPRVGAGLHNCSSNWLESRIWRSSLRFG